MKPEIEFNSHIEEIKGPMLHHIIPVPQQVISRFKPFKGSLRVLCKFGKADEFPCALIPRSDSYFITASKRLLKKAGVIPGQEIKVTIRLDENDGLALPVELAEVLLQDSLGSQLYEALSPGKKRSMIYYISSSPNIDTRIKRCFYMLEKLKSNQL